MYEYILSRSKRKTISMRISENSDILVYAPLYCSKRRIDAFVNKNSDWIQTQFERMKNRPDMAYLSNTEIEKLKEEASKHLKDRLRYYEQLTGLKSEYMKITSAKQRLGSCNAKNGICFSYRLMLFSEPVIDYVVLHELCHVKHKNHSRQFYETVEKYMPDYKNRVALQKGIITLEQYYSSVE